MNAEPNYPVKALARALSILEVLLHYSSPISITQLSQQLGIFPSTVHRMIDTLKYWGFVEQIPHTQEYTLGLKVVELGMAKLHQLNVFNEATPFLKQIAEQFNETVNLGVLDQGEVVYLDKVESTRIVKAILHPGRRAFFHCTAIGKVLMAFQPKSIRSKYIKEKKLTRYNQNTITDPEVLENELLKIRESGYALDNGEQVEEVHCVAVPIYDLHEKVIAAISISAPAFRMSPEKKKKMISISKKKALEISKRLGYKILKNK
jgi:IclR family transcriptional regulator, KDG regulon repressor